MPNYFKNGQGNQWLRSVTATCDFRISHGTANSAHCTSLLHFPDLKHAEPTTLPSFNAVDTLISNTANADFYNDNQFRNFARFFWYFLVSAVDMPLMLTPARKTALRGILTRRLINVLSIVTLNIPEATLRLLGQPFSHVVDLRFWNISYASSCNFLPASSTLVTSPGPCLGSRIMGPREPKTQLGELDTNCNSSFFFSP